uniref:Sushi domain-containing protein n=1 Tax=Mola mola TaxID=94237 RepID=A0A3Q3WVQ2_MOLML
VSASTMSVSDASGTVFRNTDRQSPAQCTPMPLPTLGTQRIIQGNGTNVGTVISLQCPANHRLVGSELRCVTDTNSTHWEGETYCKSLSPYEDYGFRVAVLASIASLAIIFLMSVAFVTCCLLACIKRKEKKREERESDAWQREEQALRREGNRSRCTHKGRNSNNNNNSQEKNPSQWDHRSPAVCDSRPACRCHQQYACGPTPSLSALPGHGYAQSASPRNPESAHISASPSKYGPPPAAHHTLNPGTDRLSAAWPGSLWQYGGQQSSLSAPSTTDESERRNTNPAKEFSIRIISV